MAYQLALHSADLHIGWRWLCYALFCRRRHALPLCRPAGCTLCCGFGDDDYHRHVAAAYAYTRSSTHVCALTHIACSRVTHGPCGQRRRTLADYRWVTGSTLGIRQNCAGFGTFCVVFSHKLCPNGQPFVVNTASLIVLVPVGLVLKEPNLGTAVIIGGIGASLFFAAGMRLWQIVLLLLPVPSLIKFAYNHLHDYQRARITTFLHPENDPLGAGYNIIQSKIALGSGGMWGQGYLHGSQGQLNFLPEKQTDFIFTMIAEEWGFVGAAAVIGLLLMIILGGMIMAIHCRNRFGRLIALGISMNFFFYCLVNLSMVMGAIPVGGVPLPLVSYGGSAMLNVMLGFGLLLSTWVHRDSVDDEDEEDANKDLI